MTANDIRAIQGLPQRMQTTLRPIAHAIRSLIGTNGLAERVRNLEQALTSASGAKRALQEPDTCAPATPSVAQINASAPAAPAIDVNLMLHQSRGALLRGMPSGAQRLLSAGCAGLWYFEWIEQTYGRVSHHFGIEYYSPKPEGLPDNVEWITNTVSDMSGVSTGTCDLVFSGQNLEHLWPEEVAGFALEAARVLRPGGHLIIDSPNRTLTAPLLWSHPEHTIELTPEEARRLVQLAGFDVSATYGIWLCRDPRTGAMLNFDPNQPSPGWSATERLLFARDHADDSFIWWIEAVRSGRESDTAAVHALMSELFHRYWPERVQRLQVSSGFRSQTDADGEWIVAEQGQAGAALFGPYLPLRAGRYRVSWFISSDVSPDHMVGVCEAVVGQSCERLASHDVRGGESRVSVTFELSEMTFCLQFRCLATGGARFRVARRIELEELRA